MKTSNDNRTDNANGVGISDWLASPSRCSFCGGQPHTLGECPACASKEEMERHIKRLHKALDNIQDIPPWGPAEAEAMRNIAIKALNGGLTQN